MPSSFYLTKRTTDPNFPQVVGTGNGVIETLRHWATGTQQDNGSSASRFINPLVDAKMLCFFLRTGLVKCVVATKNHLSYVCLSGINLICRRYIC
jgi:hypothetical protein